MLLSHSGSSTVSRPAPPTTPEVLGDEDNLLVHLPVSVGPIPTDLAYPPALAYGLLLTSSEPLAVHVLLVRYFAANVQ